jgi:hypothetical protein
MRCTNRRLSVGRIRRRVSVCFHECLANSLRFADIHFSIASCASFMRLYGAVDFSRGVWDGAYQYAAGFPSRRICRMMKVIGETPVRWIVPLILLAVPCFWAKTGRVPCNVHNRGRLWPEKANTDAAVAGQAGRCGQLLMCSLVGFKYDWQPLTVHVSQFGKVRTLSISGCGQNAVRAGHSRDSGGAISALEPAASHATTEESARRP